MKYYAIIVAGGTGSRMQHTLPKQFLPLAGKPVLMHSMETFFACGYQPDIIIVLNRTLISEWGELCVRHNFTTPHRVTEGGLTRYDSVKNGLKLTGPNSVIAVHDAARPLVSTSLITRCYEQASEYGNAIPAVQSTDSIRVAEHGGSRVINREDVYRIQTPQTFKSEILHDAFEQAYDTAFTDDASVIEKAGHQIRLIPGESSNMKITYPGDLLIAETLLKNRR